MSDRDQFVVAVAVNGDTTRRLPEVLLDLVVPIVILVYMLTFTKTYPEKVLQQSSNAPGTLT